MNRNPKPFGLIRPDSDTASARERAQNRLNMVAGSNGLEIGRHDFMMLSHAYNALAELLPRTQPGDSIVVNKLVDLSDSPDGLETVFGECLLKGVRLYCGELPGELTSNLHVIRPVIATFGKRIKQAQTEARGLREELDVAERRYAGIEKRVLAIVATQLFQMIGNLSNLNEVVANAVTVVEQNDALAEEASQ